MPNMKLAFRAWRAKHRRRLLQQIIPAEDNDDATDAADKKSIKVISRPGFSLPLMTNNFRRFNAR